MRVLSALSASALAVLLVQPSSIKAQQGPPPGVPGAQVVAAVRHDTSPALRDLPMSTREIQGARETREPKPVKRGSGKAAGFRDPVLQDTLPLAMMPATLVNFDGVNNRDGVLPPDTNGDVGPNHYVQWVNLSLAVYSKSGTLLLGPTNGNTIFTGFTGPCETSNDGDPVVLYDELADRWMLTQFALPNYPAGPFYQCVAVSKTGDPTGQYHRYQFAFDKMNDYPKLGVWPDGYYLAINQFAARTGSWAGQGVAVFEREKMLAGQAARMVYFDMASDGSLGGMLPSDFDGTPPPAGAPNVFMQFDDSPDQMQLWEFHADWANTANATFTKKTPLSLAAFDPNLCNYSRSCIPQGGTSAKLDAISDRLMFRLQYRNFGSYETWVVNHSVDATSSDRAGVRWYEIRKANNAYSVYQQGTYSPDTTHRWMGSAAMDSAGNIAIAYNTSSSGSYPSVRYTGRLATDPLGVMTQAEADIVVGSGGQTSTSSRWGDYSMLAVDPSDGCTFWATLEYIATTGSAPWRTRIASFKFPNCGTPPPSPPAAPTGLAATAASSSQVGLTWTDASDNESGFRIERCSGNGCSNFAEIATVSAGVAAYTDSGLTGSTSYSYRVRAYNAGGTSAYSNTATATTLTPPPAPPAAPTALKAVAGKGRITLTWTDNSTDETRFEIYRAAPAATYTVGANVTTYVNTGLTKGVTYSYTVKACNANGCSAASNSASARVK